MNWSNLAVAAEILSSVAVLLTLIYLAIQTRQNTQATQATGRQMTTSLDIQLSLNQADNASVFAQAFNSELSDEQKVFFDAWLTAFLRLRELDWFNYQAGTLDLLTWESYLSATKLVLSVPNFRGHWSHARGLYDQKFASTVDAIIEETPTIDTFDEFFG